MCYIHSSAFSLTPKTTMASDSDRYMKTKDIILSRKNWQRWFDDLELFFESKGIEYAVQQTIVEYARIADAPTPFTSASTSKSDNTGDLADTLNKLSLGGDDKKREVDVSRAVLNIEKKKEYLKASAKCKLKINHGLDDIDRDFVRVHSDAKTRWDTLKAKYSRTSPQDIRGLLQQITSFKYRRDKNGNEIDMTIDSAWSILREARRRVSVADPSIATTFRETQLFGFLINGLPLEFSITKQTLDA